MLDERYYSYYCSTSVKANPLKFSKEEYVNSNDMVSPTLKHAKSFWE